MRLRLGVLESLSDTTNLKRSVSSLEKQDIFDGYTKVVISVSDDVEYSAGTDTGRTMTLVCPWGTQAMAEKLLSRVRGFQYQPFTVSGAHLDPSVELGDGVTVGKVYSGVFTKDVSHGPLYTADVSAPGGEKINYQHPYKSPQDRIVSRQFRDVRASLSIQSDKISAEVEERQKQYGLLRATLNIQAQEIEAKVSKEGGNSSFSWKLLSTKFSVSGKNEEKFRVDEYGAFVNGEIRASSGKIGGFDIQSNYLSYNGQTWGGTNTIGAYIGQFGIQLGKNFKVDMSGNLKASAGTFGGTLYCDKLYVKNKSGGYDEVSVETMNSNLEGGGEYKSSGWGNYSASKTWSGASYGLDYGKATNRSSGAYPGFFSAGILECSTLLRNNRKLTSKVATINGEIVTLAVWK